MEELRQQETQDVAEVVRGIRQQRRRSGDDAERGFGDDDKDVERDAQGKGAVVCGGSVSVSGGHHGHPST